MAQLLYRLGRLGVRRRGVVTTLWLVLLGALIGGVVTMGKAPVTGVTIPGTESQRARDALAQEFPQAGGASGTVVVRVPEGRTVMEPDIRKQVLLTVRDANELPGVVGATNPYDTKAIGKDGRYALLAVQFAETADRLDDRERTAYEEFGDDAPAGWRIAAGGEPLMTEPEVGSTEGIGVAVALVVLLLTFGSLVAAGMTMLTALIGVGAGMAGILLVGHALEMSATAPVLALMLGLAVGIDYSLFITSRHRHNLALGLDREEAVGRAVGTAGSAVVFAGLTVVIALAGLAVVGIPFLTVMGLAAAATVTIAVLVAVTLLPALLGFAGDRVLPRSARKAGAAAERAQESAESAESAGSGAGGSFAWGRFVRRARIPLLLVGLVVPAVLAVPAAGMQLALPDDGTAASGTSKRATYDLVTEGFGEGFNGRLVMVVHADTPAEVRGTVKQASATAGRAGVLAVAPPQTSPDGRTALVGIVPKTGPSDPETFDLVRDLRDDLAPVADRTGADIALTGVTAVGIDVSEKLESALPVYLLVVVGLSFLLLMLVFRSVLVPLKATLGFLLSLGAAFGAAVAVFQWGWLSELVGVDRAGPLVSFLPVLLTGILFGLAMDYEVFLVSRMREDFVHGADAKDAVVSGVGHGARVVVAAAAIMISVFAGFVLVEDAVVKSMGFALAFGVLIDAFVIRLALVPAVMSFLGAKAWWLPRWLDRALPNVDIEGESLRAGEPAVEEPVREAEPVH